MRYILNNFRRMLLPMFTLLSIALGSTAFADTSSASNQKVTQERIARVINGLLPETAFDNRYGNPVSLKVRMAYFHTPGVSIAVINNFQIEWARGFGVMEQGKNAPVTTTTLFQAGSISKPVFALAVMKLVQAGKLNLDEDVNHFLTTWKVPPNGSWQPRVTLRQLLSHTAGLTQHGFAGYARGQEIPSVVDILNGQPPANSNPIVVNILPGTQLRYSGGGTTIAQQLVVDVLHKPFPKIMDELVLEPLNLRNSTYEQPLTKSWAARAATGHPQNGYPVPGKWHVYPEMAAAGLWTTPTELAKIGIELQLALKRKSEKILSNKTIAQMLEPGIAEDMGIGFFLSGKDDDVRFGHNGADEGFLALATFYKNTGQGAVIMINSNEGWQMLGEIERAIAREYKWPGYFVEEKKAVAVAPSLLQELVGNYESKSKVSFEITKTNDQAFLTLKGQAPIPLSAQSETKFFVTFLNSEITFDKDTNGKVKSLTLLQNGDSIVAEKKL